MTALTGVLEGHTADDRAAFVGYLVLVAGADVDLEPALLPHLRHFLDAAGLTVEGLDVAERQRRVDRYFEAHPLPPELLAWFNDQVKETFAATAAEDAERVARNAAGLLGTATTVLPIGHTKVQGALPGGVGGLLRARLAGGGSDPPKGPARR